MLGKIMITNIETIPGWTIKEHYGIVSGSTVRSKNAIRDVMSSIKNLFGGELKAYTELLKEARNDAIKRMTEQAMAMNANAIINVRFATSSVTAGAAELYAYGTAVYVVPTSQIENN